MRPIVLIACASKKRSYPAAAAELYSSTLFNLSLSYGRSLRPAAMHILSAKHHLLDLETVIEPYNLTLNKMPVAAVRAWAERMRGQLEERYDLTGDHFVFLAGEKYRRFLTPHLGSYVVPMEGLRIGEQLRFLKERTG